MASPAPEHFESDKIFFLENFVNCICMSLFYVGVIKNRILIHVFFSKKPNFTSYFLSDFTIISKSKHTLWYQKATYTNFF